MNDSFSRPSEDTFQTLDALSRNPLISVTSLSKDYRINGRHIKPIYDISFTVSEGEFVAITGASGSGKSTLLHLLGGLDTPSNGSITIDGQQLSQMKDRKLSNFRNQTIGFVFQFFYLQPFLTLEQNLKVASMPLSSMTSKELHARSTTLARLVGLEDRLTYYPKELSGGQMQRAAIARALFNQPKIILADEPTGNLDSANSKLIVKLFEDIRNELGTTIIIVTHDPSIAQSTDREIILENGTIR